MRSIDWGQTALGPVESWPQSLRTTVSTCLHSRFPILIWWGPDLVKIYNSAYRPMIGDKHPRAMGARGSDVWPEIWDIIGPMLRGVLERGEATWSENELLLLQRHGFVEECYFTFSYSPIQDESGGVGGIFCAVTETTTSVIDARRLKTLQRVAHESLQARSVVDVCRQAQKALGFSALDVPFVLFYAFDERAERAELLEAGGFAEALPSELRSIAIGAGHSGAPFSLAEVRRRREPILVELGAELQLEVLPGRPPYESALVLPLGPSPEQSFSGALVAGISARLRFEGPYRSFLLLLTGQVASAIANLGALEKARARAEELAALDRAKTAFFSNVSHEFRTPLTLMLGPTEQALASPDSGLRGQALEMVYRNELRLLKLVNTLLDFSRIEAGRAKARFQPTDVATLTIDLASAFRSAMEQAGLELHVECPKLSQEIFVDREMWEGIVLNLLSNALKFTLAGSVRVRLAETQGAVELAVVDTGVGIESERLAHVFERFHRVESSRAHSHEGSGIGLALVQSLARLHGGAVRVESEVGRGSTFTVSIPAGSLHLPEENLVAGGASASSSRMLQAYVAEAMRWTAEEPTTLGASSAASALPSAYEETRGARVLVADDNADMRAYLARLLRPYYVVRLVADGAAALAAVQQERPDIVLTDVMMPKVDGFALLSALRREATESRLVVIMISARAGEEARVEALAAGADDYIVKPFSAPELVARVGAQLAAVKRSREREELLAREKAARKELERERQRLSSLFAQAPVPIAILRGAEHVVELANEHACRVWGVSSGELRGRALFDALPRLRGQAMHTLLDRALESGRTQTATEAPTRPSGGEAPGQGAYFNFVCAPLEGSQELVEGVFVLAFDVTEQVLARQSSRRLRERAEAANRAKDEFLAMLGHELRNPLAPLTTALELMRLQGSDAFARERAVIERQTRQLVDLVDDLLDVSRITQGKIRLKRELLSVSEVVIASVETVSPLLDQRRHHVELCLPEEGAMVRGDRARLTQVVSNLLTNAAKYTEPGGHVWVSVERQGAQVRIVVRDDGIGIPEQMLTRAFETFAQGRQPLDRAQGGLGLGLSIVRSLVALHGGEVVAESAGRGRGSTFTVTLPGAEAATSASESDRAPRAPAPGAAKQRQRVLIVDDNEDAAESLADYLRGAGHVVRCRYDGPSALLAADEFYPQVALLDIGLPVMDGYELADRLRRRPHLGRLRLIAITGYTPRSQEGQPSPFEAHLVKPVDLETLAELLEG